MTLQVNLDPKAYEGRWEEFRPGVRALILPFTRRIIRRVMAAASVPDPGNPDGRRVDVDLWDQHVYREIIADLDGFVGTDGAPVKCSDAVIDAVCDQVEGFAVWASEKSKALADALTRQSEAEIKNSKRSPDGKPEGRKG